MFPVRPQSHLVENRLQNCVFILDELHISSVLNGKDRQLKYLHYGLDTSRRTGDCLHTKSFFLKRINKKKKVVDVLEIIQTSVQRNGYTF